MLSFRPLSSLALILALMTGFVRGETPSLDSLVANSPFAGTAGKGGKTEPATPLEFRGVIYEGSTPFFSIFESSTRQSAWVELNETGLNYTIRSFDNANSRIQVDYQGRPLTLSLVQAPKSAHPPMPVAAATPQAPGTNPAIAPPAPNPQLPAQIAEEIRRRRALRQQAANSPAQTPAKP